MKGVEPVNRGSRLAAPHQVPMRLGLLNGAVTTSNDPERRQEPLVATSPEAFKEILGN